MKAKKVNESLNENTPISNDQIKEEGYYLSDVEHMIDEDPESWEEIQKTLTRSHVKYEDAFILQSIVAPDDYSGSWRSYTLELLDNRNIKYTKGEDQFGEFFVILDVNDLN